PLGAEMRIEYRSVSSGPGNRFVELLPKRITYTPNRKIEILYDDEVEQIDGVTGRAVHPEPSYRFVNGFGVGTTRVATRIRMYGPDPVESKMLREYTLIYKMVSGLTHRPLLQSIQECERRGVCLPQTSFRWDEGDGTFKDIPLENTSTVDHVDHDLAVLDI